MVLADTLSRAPLATEEDNCTGYEQIHLTLAESDSRLPRIRQTFADDEEMEKLEEQIKNGWPDNARQVNEIIRPYFKVRDELTTENGLVFRGERLVFRKKVASGLSGTVQLVSVGALNGVYFAGFDLYSEWSGERLTSHLSQTNP
ncbi:hypothetical protein AHF37_08908 [Paragonimus kellicotti]|nr:hypothetical protein AHF37_08908 [Paragonimus kellicotti]